MLSNETSDDGVADAVVASSVAVPRVIDSVGVVRDTRYAERVDAACKKNGRTRDIVNRIKTSDYRIPYGPTIIKLKGYKYNVCYLNRAFFERIRYADTQDDSTPPMRVLSFYVKLIDILPASKRVDWHNPSEPRNAPKINVDLYTLKMMSLYEKVEFEYADESDDFILSVKLIASKNRKKAQQTHEKAAVLTKLIKQEIEENYKRVSDVIAGRATSDTLPDGFTLTPSLVATLTGSAAIAIPPEHMSVAERVKHELLRFSLFANVKDWSDFSKQVVFRETILLDAVDADADDSDVDSIQLTLVEHIRPDYTTGAGYNAPAIVARYYDIRAQNIALANSRRRDAAQALNGQRNELEDGPSSSSSSPPSAIISASNSD